ncbi:MAG: M20/M25/M40 family metallo-hydrolase [Oscillospiraceae bacterium]|jgi:endoglucanase|nr:M20/M25/M40 family metallo-hydrolase [Oscillospiraceae bacterium]
MNLQELEQLCACAGVSGCENAVREAIIALLPKEATHTIDPLGNLIVRKTGTAAGKNTVMLCAHMDEVGLIVTEITEEGYLSFAHVGGIERRGYLGKQVLAGKRQVPGVIGLKPVHLLEGDEKENIPPEDSLRIDVGAESREAAAALVQPGERVVFAPGLTCFGDGYIKARALDDRIGCLILIELLRQALPYDMTAVFSTNEETGAGAAQAAAFALAPAYAIVVETTTAADLPGVEGTQRVCSLGGGAVVPFMDRGTVYPWDLYETAQTLAAAHGIPMQTKTKIAGGNDARSITTARGGIPTITVSVPCRGLHSPAVVMQQKDAEAVLQLVRALWGELTQK